MTEAVVAVIGLGAMGAGIAEVFAKAGHPVVGIEYNDEALERGRGILSTSVDRAVAKDKLSAEDRDALLERITWTTSTPDGVREADLVIEAVNENPDLKASIFSVVDQHAPADAVLATNTSSLSITAIAAATSRPEQVIGIHFFNPAPVQKLVEVIRAPRTGAATIERAVELLRAVGKSPIVCADRAGFIVNYLLLGYLNHAARLYQDGFADRDVMDAVMVEQAGYPMGPFTLLDMVGLDVAHSALVRMHSETGDRLHAPAAVLTQLVAAGMLGRKTGRGFHNHQEGSDEGPVTWAEIDVPTREAELPMALVAPYLNDVLNMVGRRYATPNDIDTGMALGCRMPKPFDVIAEIGPVALLEAQRAIHAETGEPAHRPARLLEELAAADDPAAALTALRG
ncbi:3-hydroxyacyl-CoA dehydrogenase NAD-binding domain-containing protein [Enemella sp. A6]|uniref:3-hydroxyacyl-CoA dehydrogenase n=1 Tax=Enemella sp. A6 TaxID=3440152 RepID=UPI003EBC2443